MSSVDIRLSGTKYNDLNGDGNISGDPAGTPGNTFTIQVFQWFDNNGNSTIDDGELTLVASTETNETTGAWSVGFSGIISPSVRYVVREVAEDGWTQTYGTNGYIVTPQTSAPLDVTGLDFANTQTQKKFDISGYKWLDVDGDGKWDAGEGGKAGWTIYLDTDTDPTNGFIASTVTDANGKYSFTNLAPGTYQVYEKSEAGWANTFNGATAVVGVGGVNQAGDFGQAEALNFGNFEKYDVSGYKWVDKDGDGVWDAGELGKAGWTIYLDSDADPTNGFVASTVTDANGRYAFSNIAPGTYKIYEKSETGWINTFNGATTIVGTSGADQAGDSGQAEALNFGNFEKFKISGYKWFDKDGDGVWDTGELGKAGWTIYLDNDTNPNNGVIATATTDANGKYTFADLGPGTYQVYEKAEAGWINTYNGATAVVGASGTNRAGDFGDTELLNFGNFQKTEISGYKWLDKDGDGKWDAGEVGKSGWTIYLDTDTNPNNGVIASTVTDANGKYTFSNLAPGTYKVYEKSESGWVNTFNGAATVTGGVGQTGDFGETEALNFGNFEKYDICGYKWLDKNGNGKWDSGEAGKSGWTIYLDTDGNPNNGYVASTTTDANGKYSFKDIGPGTYTVYEKSDAGWVNTYNGSVTFTGSSGKDLSGDACQTESLNFGNFEKFDICGYKWVDKDGDGKWDSNESGKSGWTIYLDTDTDPTNGYIASAVTDANGKYTFKDLGPGTYKVYEKSEAGWVNTYNGSTTIVGSSGKDWSGDKCETEVLNFGNMEKKVEYCYSGLTRGAWGTPDSGAGCWDQQSYKSVTLTTGTKFEAIFGIDSSWTEPGSGGKTYTNPTLLEALNMNGGGANQLIAQATAALLNATEEGDELDHPFRFTADEVVKAVKYVYGIGNANSDNVYNATLGGQLKDLLDHWNNAEKEVCDCGPSGPKGLFDLLGWA